MFGIRLILILAVMGGIIAFIADKLGSKIGKKRMSIFGLRPHDTSVVLTVLSGVLIAACTIGVLSVSSQSARTALFGMDKLNKEMAALTEQRQAAEREVENKNKLIAGLDDAIKAAQDAKIAAENNLNVAKNELATAKEQYATAQSSLVAAHSEVDNLSQARDKLNAEIKELNTETANLKQGLMTMKEGQVLYRSGEVVFAGVLNATDNQAEIDKEIQWLVSNANMAALERLGMKPDASLEPTWILKDDVEKSTQYYSNQQDEPSGTCKGSCQYSCRSAYCLWTECLSQ
jgi:cell division protein FtsB